MEESPGSGFQYATSGNKDQYSEEKGYNEMGNSDQKANEQSDPDPEEPEAEDSKDSQSEQIPLLFVDVNLGEGTTGKVYFFNINIDRIVLYDGDNPSEVAKDFSTRHNLDSSMTGKLTDLLTQQMNGVLTKIIEEGEGDDAEGEVEH